MNILVINTVGFRMNGMSSVILNYFRAMGDEDFKIDFVATKYIYEGYKEEIEQKGSKVYLLNNKKTHPFSYIKRLKKIINENNYDIVHVHGNSALMAMEMHVAKKCKVQVRIAHSHNTTCTFKLLHKILYSSFIKNCTHRFACGIDAGKWLYREKDFIVINNGVNGDSFKFNKIIREEYRKSLGIDKEILLGHVGNFVYQKNHNLLIDIFNEISKRSDKYKLLLIGEGELLEESKKKTKDLNLENKIIFLGKSSKVAEYMQAMDAIVLPSRFEGLPLTLIEAQTSGLNCFVSDKVSVEANIIDLVKFIPTDRINEWVDIILNDDNYSKNEEREASYKKVVEAGYDMKTNGKKLSELYRKFIRESKNLL